MTAPRMATETDDLLERLRERLGESLIVERELGNGGMSRVFLAHDPALKRAVVVKVLSGVGSDIPVERFRREMLTAASLQHPHIVPILSAGDVDGIPWYTMPMIAGSSLRERIGNGAPMSVRDALRVLRDVSRALSYAHGRGIVHRDLKPDNIMLTGDAAVIIDFGIAKALTDATDTGKIDLAITQAGFTLGTPAYMAPEQAAADPELDHRADIYSFGVVAYELLGGQPPFTADTTHLIIVAHMTAPIPSLGELRSGLPEPLCRLVEQCLAKNPDHRPASADAILERLEQVPTSTVLPSTPLLRPGHRRSAILIGVAALIVALMLLVG